MATKKTGKKMGKMNFSIDFDNDEIPPDFPAGQWEAKLVKFLKKVSQKGYPMLELTWKFLSTDNDENEAILKKTPTKRDWIVFAPKGVPGERMMKLKVRSFCENFDLDQSTLPKGKIKDWDAFAEFLEQLKGLSGTIWTVIEKRNGEEQTQIKYSGDGLDSDDDGDDEDEDEDEDEETEDSADADDEDESDDDDDDDDDSEDDDSDDDSEEDEDEDEDEEPAAKKKATAKKTAAKKPAAGAKKKRAA